MAIDHEKIGIVTDNAINFFRKVISKILSDETLNDEEKVVASIATVSSFNYSFFLKFRDLLNLNSYADFLKHIYKANREFIKDNEPGERLPACHTNKLKERSK